MHTYELTVKDAFQFVFVFEYQAISPDKAKETFYKKLRKLHKKTKGIKVLKIVRVA